MSIASNEIKDRYFFIDYLRLHRFGKQAGIWKKNRNMLVKEHEYHSDHNIRARKGYQSYVQRCMKSIIDWYYPDFDIVKPRGVFGYEVGRKNDYQRSLLNIAGEEASSEDKIKMIIQRNLVNKDYQELISEYLEVINDSPGVALKNRDGGLKLSLNIERSEGYRVVQRLPLIRSIQNKLIEEASNTDLLLKKMIVKGLDFVKKIPKGTSVEIIINESPSRLMATVLSADYHRSHRGTSIIYKVKRDDNNREERIPRADLKIIDGTSIAVQEEDSFSPIIRRVLNYANQNFTNTSGVNSEVIFNLSKSIIIRELLAENEMDLATELRRFSPSSVILSEINVVHEVIDEDEDIDDE